MSEVRDRLIALPVDDPVDDNDTKPLAILSIVGYLVNIASVEWSLSSSASEHAEQGIKKLSQMYFFAGFGCAFIAGGMFFGVGKLPLSVEHVFALLSCLITVFYACEAHSCTNGCGSEINKNLHNTSATYVAQCLAEKDNAICSSLSVPGHVAIAANSLGVLSTAYFVFRHCANQCSATYPASSRYTR